MQPHQHLVIIGNGIAGITLAQQVRKKSQCAITIISVESKLHFSRTALMYVYMGHMRYQDIVPYADWYYQEQQLNTIQDRVIGIDFKNKTLRLEKEAAISYDILVLAVGSSPAFHDWPGISSKGVQGLVSLQDLELMEQQSAHTKQAVIVGGGLIGIEMAEMLRSRGVEVTMLVRDSLFWKSNLPSEEAKLITDHIQHSGINLILNDELEEVIADSSGQVSAVRTRNGVTLPCQFVGVAIGVKPNITFVKSTDLETDTGIIVDQYFRTNIEHVYAIGDCAQFQPNHKGASKLEQLWYTGRQHGEALASILTGNLVPYERGPWFNSAKFLDIEFQTYGVVPPVADDEKYVSFYWQHPDGTKSIRILFDKMSEKLVGINLLGIRYRHELCHHWLKNNYTIHQVMQELLATNFDAEFFKRFEPELLKQYLSVYPDKMLMKEKITWWSIREKFRLYRTPTKTSNT